MRVGIVTPKYPPAVAGGGEISVKLLAEELSKHDIEVTVFSFDGGNTSVVNGVSVTRFDLPTHKIMEVSNLWAICALLRNRTALSSCDVLHAYNITLHPAVGYISSTIDIPSVATLNSYDLLPKSAFGVSPERPRRLYELLAMPTTGRILRRGVKQIDQFVALSEASRQVYRNNGFSGVPINVVPNMLDTSFETPTASRDSDRYNLLYVGSLIKEKGVSYLVRAMELLPDDVHLRIVGSGDREEKIRSLSHDINVAERVELTGGIPYEDVRRHYAFSNCFVHPGVWPEPFGRTILEAMQAALPVVTTNIGGPAEVVPQEQLRCTPKDPSSLAKSIKKAREQPSIGESNRTYVNDRYAPEKVIGQLLDVYDKAIAGN